MCVCFYLPESEELVPLGAQSGEHGVDLDLTHLSRVFHTGVRYEAYRITEEMQGVDRIGLRLDLGVEVYPLYFRISYPGSSLTPRVCRVLSSHARNSTSAAPSRRWHARIHSSSTRFCGTRGGGEGGTRRISFLLCRTGERGLCSGQEGLVCVSFPDCVCWRPRGSNRIMCVGMECVTLSAFMSVMGEGLEMRDGLGSFVWGTVTPDVPRAACSSA